MRCTITFLVFLSACSTQSKVRDERPAAAPPGPGSAASAATPAATAADAPIERTYRSSVPICFDAALRVCRDRDIAVRSEERGGDRSAALRGQARSFEFTLAFARTPDNRTRARIQVHGRALQEHRDEAARLLDRLCEALLEPRD